MQTLILSQNETDELYEHWFSHNLPAEHVGKFERGSGKLNLRVHVYPHNNLTISDDSDENEVVVKVDDVYRYVCPSDDLYEAFIIQDCVQEIKD